MKAWTGNCNVLQSASRRVQNLDAAVRYSVSLTPPPLLCSTARRELATLLLLAVRATACFAPATGTRPGLINDLIAVSGPALLRVFCRFASICTTRVPGLPPQSGPRPAEARNHIDDWGRPPLAEHVLPRPPLIPPLMQQLMAGTAGMAKQRKGTGGDSGNGQTAQRHWRGQREWPNSAKTLAGTAGMAKQRKGTGGGQVGTEPSA